MSWFKELKGWFDVIDEKSNTFKVGEIVKIKTFNEIIDEYPNCGFNGIGDLIIKCKCCDKCPDSHLVFDREMANMSDKQFEIKCIQGDCVYLKGVLKKFHKNMIERVDVSNE